MLLGLHHVTALAGDPQRNLDFYAGFLGLRLVKRTVNFDEPHTYHFYFGDRAGTPGTLLTFFTWPGAFRGRRGSGQAVAVSFAIPANTLGRWIERARIAGVPRTGPETRFGEELITIEDGDGVAIELVASAPKSDDDAIVRLHSVTLCESDAEGTTALLQENLGFRSISEEGARARFDLAGSHLDIVRIPGAERGKMSVGAIHHVAWRVKDEAEQLEWRTKLVESLLRVSAVRDRKYFRSIYFREPGGILFEIATDGPGFAVDEPPEALGTGLCLPPWLESVRSGIERRLPAVTWRETEWLVKTP
ncbi:MAG: ring-cleaving dioxygenase [Bryobacteraceae bacterium]